MQAVTIKRICDTQQQRSYNVYPSRFDEAIRGFAAASFTGHIPLVRPLSRTGLCALINRKIPFILGSATAA
jgi:hypothetical protein